MKQVFAFTAISALIATGAQAVEFNKDALKSMQEEGHKIVEESQAGRPYKSTGGLCLDIAGNGLVVRNCNANSKTHTWAHTWTNSNTNSKPHTWANPWTNS